MALKQANRLLSLSTPLGEDVLFLTGFQGHEEMSRLFQFQLDMISDDPNIQAKDMVGQNVTFGIKLADETPRYFNGIVNRFYAGDEREGRRNYRAEVVPWLWFLTRTSDCRIFQKKTAPDIIEKIFKDLGFSDYKLSASGTHPEREYCVQYRETDFNFVSRLMEEEGMFYFFSHDNGKHELVIADKSTAYVDCIENEVDYPTDTGSHAIEDHLTSWEHRYEFRSGKFAQTDFDFQNPSTDLMNNSNSVIKLSGNDKYEFYDYPGIYIAKGDGKSLTDVRMEEEEVDHDTVFATSGCKSFTPGGKFKTRQHRSPSEEGKSYVITSIRHRASEPQAYETGTAGAFDYTNSFTCIPDNVTFRPARVTPKPFVQGVQTAIVTGPKSEEIHTDEFGRVTVQFHWDREGQRDEKSSCWIRVSQVHAGKGFGAIDLPRIGEEVIVDFLEGDPDRPIIVGRVYHKENMPPFGLPTAKNVSGMKSNSTKGGGGYNEFTLDDTKGKEKITVHGQRDMGTVIEHDQTLLVKNDRTNTVKGKFTETITKDTKIKIVSGTYEHDVAGNKATYHVQGDLKETYSAKQTTKVTGTIDYSSGADIKITAADSILLTVGSSSLKMDKAGNINLTGVKVTVHGSNSVRVDGSKVQVTGKAEAKLGVGSQNIACDVAKVAVSGAAINSSAVGMHEITGAVVKIN